MVQLPYQLCVGNCSGPELWKARSVLRPDHILRTTIVAMRNKSYTTCLLPLDENGWMLTGDEYGPVRCLYKPAPVAILELITCGCKTSCKGHCSHALLSANATIQIAATFLTTGWQQMEMMYDCCRGVNKDDTIRRLCTTDLTH